MITAYFHGEMGNNIFQLAAVIAHAEKTGVKTEFIEDRDSPVSSYRPLELPVMFDYKFNFVDTYSINYEMYQHRDLSLDKTNKNFEFGYTPIIEKDNLILRGYFQSEKYFENIKDKIKNEYFKPSADIVKSLEEKWTNKYNFSNSISIHVRMAGDRKNDNYFPFCPDEYYINAVTKILTLDSNVENIFCFSDNIEWCKENMSSDDIIFIEENSAVEDMFLMSYCKHNIIGNSSFSWWAAYLNINSDKIVIVPNSWWFGSELGHLNKNDLFLNDWIKL